MFGTETFVVIFFCFYLVYAFAYKYINFRIIYVLVFSLFFYYKADGYFVSLLFFAAFFNYTCGLYIEQRRWLLIFAISVNLLILAYFKYTAFLITNVNYFAGANFIIPKIILPIGISFYLFQAISYCIDVYRKDIKAETNFFNFAFYLCFFPALVAGPIVRAKDFIPQIKAAILISKEHIGGGLFLFLLGIVKKTIISDYISLNFVDRVFSSPELFTSIENALAVYGYTIQIYCDFSGYSDMAIGLALFMGFKLPMNFRTPYKSRSITEFWKRWHISLSSWLRDYLYISLGGNRRGKIRTYINLILTMLIGGLWHGASWKFVVWGGLHGLALAVERYLKNYVKFPQNTFIDILRILFVFHFVAFCFIFFRSSDFSTALKIIENSSNILKDFLHIPEVAYQHKYILFFMSAALILHFLPQNFVNVIKRKFILSPIFVKVLSAVLIFYFAYSIASSDVQPFIYFQF